MNGAMDLTVPSGLSRATRTSPPIFFTLVPRAVTNNEDGVAVFLWEHLPGVEPHAERCAVRPELCDRPGEFIAAAAPAELGVGNVAAVAIGKAEIVLAGMEHAVELVLRLVLGEPVTLVLGEIQHSHRRVPVHADDLTNAASHHFGAATVQIDAADLCVTIRWHADVARRANVEIELVVRPDGQEFPAMRGIAR